MEGKKKRVREDEGGAAGGFSAAKEGLKVADNISLIKVQCACGSFKLSCNRIR